MLSWNAGSGWGVQQAGITGAVLKAGPGQMPAGRRYAKQEGWGLLGSQWDPKTGPEPALHCRDRMAGTTRHLTAVGGAAGGIGRPRRRTAAPIYSSLGLSGTLPGLQVGTAGWAQAKRDIRCPKDESGSSGTLIPLGHGQLMPRWLGGGYKNEWHTSREAADTGKHLRMGRGGDSEIAEGQSAWRCPAPNVRLWGEGATPWAVLPSPEQQVPVSQGQENPGGQRLDGQPSRRPCPSLPH